MPAQEVAKYQQMFTDTELCKAKPGASPLKLPDGGGMYLLLKPDGSRYSRMNYRYNGKQKTLSLGVYPRVTLPYARHRDLTEAGERISKKRKVENLLSSLRIVCSANSPRVSQIDRG